MNETLKKVSAEFKANLEEAIASGACKDLIQRTKEANDAGTFEVVISTADIDRSGESIDQKGWNLELYKMNPVVLWGHDYYALPIGICDSIEIAEGKLIAKGRFAPADANPFAQQVRRLYDAKIVRATSVGFIVSEMEGNNITKAELLEFSFVPVPANPYALSLAQAKEIGLDIAMLSMKGLNTLTKAEGDTCSLEDGTDGIIDAEGVCVPKPAEEASKAEGDTCTLEDGSEGAMNAEGVCVAKVEEKGAVEEELADQGAWEKKWEKLNAFCDIVDAVFNTYLDEATPVEAFESIVAEAADLIKALAGETKAEAKIAEALTTRSKAIEAGEQVKTFVHRKEVEDMLQAIGAELATMQASVDTSITDSAKKILEIASGDGGVVQEDGATKSEETIETVESKGVDAIVEFEKFQTNRLILRALATATTNALEAFNAKARAYEKEGRR